MKKIIPFFLSTIFLISCDFSDMSDDKIQGNGVLEENTFIIDEFFNIDIDGAYNLVFIQDSTWQVLVEAESNILPLIDIYKNNNTLIVKNESGIEFDLNEPIVVEIHHQGINSLDFAGAGKISGKNYYSQIHYYLSGASEVNMELICSELDVTVSGTAVLTFSGEAIESYITIAGTGTVYAEELVVEKSWNTISGEGTEYLNVSEQLSADISGVGYIYYIGNPVLITKILGVGSVTKKQ